MEDTEDTLETAFLWVACLQQSPGMLELYYMHLRMQSNAAQAEIDHAIDKGDFRKASRAKGQRDAYDTLLHQVRARAQGA
jgi:hypothetical protein